MEKLNFVIKGKSFSTEAINVGRMIDLWKMRAALSMGSYGQLYRMALESSDDALLMIDIEAFFTVFCPEFITALKPGSVRDMGLEDYLELRDLYISEIMPWLIKVEGLLKKKSNVE